MMLARLLQIFRRRSDEPMDTPNEHLYQCYMVSMEFLDGVAGGRSPIKNLIERHVERFKQQVTNDMKIALNVEGEVTEEAIQSYLETCTSLFPVDEKGIYLAGHQFQAMLKDSAQRTKMSTQIKSLNNTIRDGGVLFPQRVYLNAVPTTVQRHSNPDGGKSNIKNFQIAEQVKLSVPCAILQNGDLPLSRFHQLWIVGEGIGMGANRHLGYGQFRLIDIQPTGGWNPPDLLEGKVNGESPLSTSPVPVEYGAVLTPSPGAPKE